MFFSFFLFKKKKCVIARDNEGIMMLIKISYLIRVVDENRTNRVKLTIRFFNLKDGVIQTTDKTEIEVDD